MYNHLLDVFKIVADEGSINKASKKLFCSPVSVYKDINKLEKQLGVLLFKRDNKGSYLTEDGQKVYDGFIKIKEISDSITNEFIKDITFNIYVPLLLKNDIKNDISFININAKYNLVTLEDYKLNEMIENHKIGKNFCFGINDHFKEVNYDFLQLGDLSLGLSVPKCSKLAMLEKINFEDVRGEKLLFLKKGVFKSFDIFCQSLCSQCDNIIQKEYRFFSDPDIERYKKEGYCFVTIGIFNDIDENYITIPFDCVFKIPYGLFCDYEEVSKYVTVD